MIGGAEPEGTGGTDRSADANWPPLWKRSAGLSESARAITASNSGEAPRASVRMGGATPANRWLAIAAAVVPANGSLPATIS